MKNNNPLYQRIVTIVFIILAVSISFSSLGYYLTAKSVMLKQQEETARRDLTQISYTERLIAELAHSAAAQVFSDPSMARLLFFQEADVQTLSTGLSRLDRFRWNNPHIHSIYLYNPRNGTVFVSDDDADHAVQSLEELFDRDMARIFFNRTPADLDMKLFPRMKEIQDNRAHATRMVPVLSLVYFGNHSTLTASQFSAVIVNLSEDWIRKTLDALNTDPNYRIGILVPSIDRDRSVFLPRSSDDELPEQIKSAVLKTEEAHARFILEHNGHKEIVTVHNPDFSDWRFYARSDYSIVMAPLHSFGKLSIILAAASLAMALLISLFGSIRIYKPVKDISENLRSIEELRRQDRKKLQMETFHHLLYRDTRWPDDVLLKTLEDFELLSDRRNESEKIIPVFLRRKVSAEDKRNTDSTVFDRLTEQLSRLYSVAVLTENSGSALLLVFYSDDGTELNNILDRFVENDDPRFIALGPAAEKPTDLPGAIDSTIDLGSYLYTFGYGNLVNASTIPMKEPPSPVILDRLEQELVTAILDGEELNAKAVLKELRGKLEYTSPNRAAAIFISLLHRLQELVQNVRTYYHQDFRGRYYRMYTDVQHADTILEAQKIMLSFLSPLILAISHDRSHRQTTIAENVSEYIRDHYRDPNLYIQGIADSFHLSAPYLGRIYRQQTGSSIPVMINTIRVEQACHLLTESETPIEMIASEVGFSSKTYFHRVFKKLIGTTPKIYRESKRNFLLKAQ